MSDFQANKDETTAVYLALAFVFVAIAASAGNPTLPLIIAASLGLAAYLKSEQ